MPINRQTHRRQFRTEDNPLLASFTLVCRLYWSFNAFTQIIQLLDFILHVWIILDAICFKSTSSFIYFGSFSLITFSCTYKCYRFHHIHPLYFLVNNFPCKYSKISRIRLIQLWHRYHDIVARFAVSKKSANATKNYGYLNIRILATVFVEDFGSPKLPFPCFAVHEIVESIPHLLFLFTYITYNQIQYTLYTTSILVSVICISCQIFNYLATMNNIHYSILSARFLCIVTDIFGTLSYISCLSLYYFQSTLSTNILTIIYYIIEIKFKFITLALSFGLSLLFVLRAFAIQHVPNRPILDNIITFGLIVIFTITATIISSLAFEFCLQFYWISMLIHRLYNERFSNWDGNNNFWRRVIEWNLADSDAQILQNNVRCIQKTKDKVLRLFCVNTILCNSGQFNDIRLKQWMDDVYKLIFYTYYDSEYEITLSDFNKNSLTNIHNIKDIFQMVIKEQIASYFTGRNQSTTADIIHLMNEIAQLCPFVWCTNIFMVNRTCENIFACMLFIVLWIAAPLYFITHAFNVILPFITIYIMDDIRSLNSLFLVTVCYGLCVFMLIFTWFTNINVCGYGYIRCGSDVSSLIYSLCPSKYGFGHLYVSLKYGYFTQHELFERIKWHYNRHKYAQIEGEIVVDIFGCDIAREIFDFFPKSYSEEKICSGSSAIY